MQERHDILSRTIGYLDEEQEALDRGYLLLIGSTVTMVVGSLLQILFFYLYNGPFHPFANILVDETEGKESISSNYSKLYFKSFISGTSNPEQTDTTMDNTDDVTGLPSACDQSTQTDDVVDLTKEPAKENVSEEQGSILQSNSLNQTEV